MDEIASGIWHWTAFHDGIGAEVSSYYVEPVATVIDPQEPDLDWFAGRNVHRVCLTNQHHGRHADRFGVPVLRGEFGTDLAPDISSHGPIDPSWPEEGALHIRIGDGVLAIGDGAMHYGEQIHFVPEEHLGDDPERTKELLRAGYGRLLDLDFDVLLFAHGSPIVGGAKDQLRAFVDGAQ